MLQSGLLWCKCGQMKNNGSRSLLRRAWDRVWGDGGDEWAEQRAKEGPFTQGSADRRENFECYGLEYSVFLPGGLIFMAMICRDPEWTEMGYLAWPLLLLIWTPWLLWRVEARNPRGDTWRAAAAMAHTISPFSFAILVPFVGSFMPFCLTYLFGLCAMGAAINLRPPKQSRRRRTVMMAIGGLVYGALAALMLWAPLSGILGDLRQFEDFILFFGAVLFLLGILVAALALKLFAEAVKAWRASGGAVPTAA